MAPGATCPVEGISLALPSFLNALYETGRVPVDDPEAPLETHAGEADELLLVFDARARKELALTAPEYVPDAARWAATLMYRGCQLLVYRKLDGQAVKQALGIACPAPLSPGAIYSADLALHYLRDLLTMARTVAEQDVLVAELLCVAAAWPLSSIGIPQLAANQLDPAGAVALPADLRVFCWPRSPRRCQSPFRRRPTARASSRGRNRDGCGAAQNDWPDAHQTGPRSAYQRTHGS